MDNQQRILRTPAHTLAIADVASAFSVTLKTGLTNAEAEKRLSHYGPNRIDSIKRLSFLKMIVNQFANPMILLLLVVIGASLFIRHWMDAAIIGCIVIVNAAIGSLQERKAEKAMESIRKMAVPTAKVLRDGKRIQVSSHSICPRRGHCDRGRGPCSRRYAVI